MVGSLIIEISQFLNGGHSAEMRQYTFSNVKSSWTGSILISVLVGDPMVENEERTNNGFGRITSMVSCNSFTDSNNRRYYRNHNTEQICREPPQTNEADATSISSNNYPNRIQIVVSSPENTQPERYEHYDSVSSLPYGWTSCKMSDGRIFFIDHKSKTTTWSDPRGTFSPQFSPRMTSLLESSNSKAVDKLVSLPPLGSGWERRVHKNGRIFYIDHINRRTQWDDPRLYSLSQSHIQYSSSYKKKYEQFLASLRKSYSSSKFEFTVRRTHVFEDSYRALICNLKNRNLLRSNLMIKFAGEAGIDYGGVAREWFYLISKEIFNPYYGLFEYSAVDSYSLQISPMSHLANEDDISLFYFSGIILGMAAYHQKLVDVCFVKPFYKLLTERTIILEDLASVDSDYYNSLVYIKENDPADLMLDFSISENRFGKVVVNNLVKDGDNIPVTQQNKNSYINAVVKWRVVDRINKQMNSIKRGFNDIVSLSSVAIFDPQELEYLLSGIPVIDVNDWKKNTTYQNGYNVNHPVIVNFWRAIHSFDSEMQGHLLQFVTGTSRVPMNGFSELQGSNGIQFFNINKSGSTNMFPRSHTCFNRIDLPPYEDYEYMRAMLIAAIENSEGFGGVD